MSLLYDEIDESINHSYRDCLQLGGSLSLMQCFAATLESERGSWKAKKAAFAAFFLFVSKNYSALLADALALAFAFGAGTGAATTGFSAERV